MSISDWQSDTSSENTKSSLKNVHSTLHTLSQRPPFEQLYADCREFFAHPSTINTPQLTELGPDMLNALIEMSADELIDAIRFVAQDSLSQDSLTTDSGDPVQNLYYENYIYQHKSIPTRDNWHDFFNGLIWLQFPKTKALFNQMHHAQIEQFGHKTRTPIRDKLTHFDECGLLIVTDQTGLREEISEHQWHTVFVERKLQWHDSIRPFIIGHALWEMLMQPFIGLTAKVIVIESNELLSQIKAQPFNHISANQRLDAALAEGIDNSELLAYRKPWLPLPLLGIPQWSHIPQTEHFYANQNYFMPKRK